MRKQILTLSFLIISSIVLTGCGCKHEWNEATCLEPKTCSECGETEGDVSDHLWEEATCLEPKKCTICETTEGEPIGHVAGYWEIENYNYIEAVQEECKRCNYCSEIMEQTKTNMDSLHDNTKFLFTMNEFNERLNYIFDNESELYSLKSQVIDSGDTIGVVITKDTKSFYILFNNENKDFVESEEERSIQNILVLNEGEVDDAFVMGVVGTIMACDPLNNLEDSMNVLEDVIERAKSDSEDYYEKNGVTYVLVKADDMVIMSCRIDK